MTEDKCKPLIFFNDGLNESVFIWLINSVFPVDVQEINLIIILKANKIGWSISCYAGIFTQHCCLSCSYCEGDKWPSICCWVSTSAGQGQAESRNKSCPRYDHTNHNEVGLSKLGTHLKKNKKAIIYWKLTIKNMS